MSAIARVVAVVAGIAGVVLCALVPLLPVKQTTATINWPQAAGADGMVSDITAPLVSGAPQALDISIPCRAIATLPAEGGVVLSTVPRQANDATKGALFVRANADTVFVAFRDSVAAAAPRPAVAAGDRPSRRSRRRPAPHGSRRERRAPPARTPGSSRCSRRQGRASPCCRRCDRLRRSRSPAPAAVPRRSSRSSARAAPPSPRAPAPAAQAARCPLRGRSSTRPGRAGAARGQPRGRRRSPTARRGSSRCRAPARPSGHLDLESIPGSAPSTKIGPFIGFGGPAFCSSRPFTPAASRVSVTTVSPLATLSSGDMAASTFDQACGSRRCASAILKTTPPTPIESKGAREREQWPPQMRSSQSALVVRCIRAAGEPCREHQGEIESAANNQGEEEMLRPGRTSFDRQRRAVTQCLDRIAGHPEWAAANFHGERSSPPGSGISRRARRQEPLS